MNFVFELAAVVQGSIDLLGFSLKLLHVCGDLTYVSLEVVNNFLDLREHLKLRVHFLLQIFNVCSDHEVVGKTLGLKFVKFLCYFGSVGPDVQATGGVL